MVFEDLFIWKSARILVNEIYKLMYNCKDYGFRDQLQRATISIMNNMKAVILEVILNTFTF